MKKTFLKNKKNVQFLIIGLGLIGGSIAKRLSKRGFEVLAIDKNKSHLKYAKKYLYDKKTLDSMSPTQKLDPSVWTKLEKTQSIFQVDKQTKAHCTERDGILKRVSQGKYELKSKYILLNDDSKGQKEAADWDFWKN